MTRVMHYAGDQQKTDRWLRAPCDVPVGPGFPGKGSATWAQVTCPECLALRPVAVTLDTDTDTDTDTGADFGSLLSMLADARATLERRPRPLAEHRKTGEAFGAVIAALGGLYAS